jgi:hypothetical protein
MVLAHLALDGEEVLAEEAHDHVVLAADLGHGDALEADDSADEVVSGRDRIDVSEDLSAAEMLDQDVVQVARVSGGILTAAP